MARNLRGADIVARSLVAAGVHQLFTLSGNHVMVLFDAAIDAELKLIHVRHEAAAVHMADAWGRLTDEVGVALVTGGPGHANAVAPLYTALAAESPVLLLSGHAPLDEVGRGAFQELRQTELATPVTKASWLASSAANLGRDVARAIRVAKSGRPGPVHLSLPQDVLDAAVPPASAQVPTPEDFRGRVAVLDREAAEAVLAELARAARPLIIVGPVMMGGRAQDLVERLAAATATPVVGMDSPRGTSDPSLGAVRDVLARTDLIVLLGKPLDFALGFGQPPLVARDSRIVQIDPDQAVIERALREAGERVVLSAIADPRAAAERLVEIAAKRAHRASGWFDEARAAIAYRPPAWRTLASRANSEVHPIDVCRAVQQVLDRDREAVLVLDGGEFGQWARAALAAPRLLTNGPAGAIGGALPFAAAARLAFPTAPVIAMLGDGTFGFHPAEYDTAVRYALPFVALVGNDARWNAERQIQLRAYGAQRAHGCELLPTRYDLVAAAFGAHGEHVTQASAVLAALERGLHCGRPACVNIAIESVPAPNLAAPDDGHPI